MLFDIYQNSGNFHLKTSANFLFYYLKKPILVHFILSQPSLVYIKLDKSDDACGIQGYVECRFINTRGWYYLHGWAKALTILGKWSWPPDNGANKIS